MKVDHGAEAVDDELRAARRTALDAQATCAEQGADAAEAKATWLRRHVTELAEDPLHDTLVHGAELLREAQAVAADAEKQAAALRALAITVRKAASTGKDS